jgi:hypothetical protein
MVAHFASPFPKHITINTLILLDFRAGYRVLSNMSETLEQAFCRIASEVVREQNLASLERSMHPDLFRFIHYAQEKMKAETRHTRRTSGRTPDCPASSSPANRTRHTQPAEV